jgi:type I restriction enzyme S subunit
MTRYDKYKPSGIEWIGDIPEHWEVKRLKRFAKICNGQDHKSVYELDGEYPIMGSGGEFGRANSFLHPGPSVLLGRKGTVDKPRYVDFPFWSVDTAYFTDIYEITNPRFFYYLCTTINFELYKYGSAVPSMSQEVLNQIEFTSPPTSEQTAIATYLDRKTAEIDRIIAYKQKLIVLYEEEKQTIINQAVTRGVDKTVKLKPSGVEWLGDIPEHWEVKKLKWLHGTMSGGTPKTSDSNYYEGDIPWLRSLDLNNGDVTDCEIRITQKAIAESATKIVPLNSVLLAMYGGAGTIGKSGLLKFEATINQAICAIIPNEQTLPEYLHYFVIFYRPYWMIGAEGTRRDPNISQDDIKNREFLFPPSKEQLDIVSYIEKECSRLDTLIVKYKKQIALFQEYRTTLISEVVTGKVKV